MTRRPLPLVVIAVLAAASPALAWEMSAQGGGFAAKLPAAEAIKGPDDKPAKPTLTISCRPDGLFATVAWPEAIPLNAGQHFVTVSWSLDGRTRSSPMLASSGSVGFAGSEAKEWLREMAGAKQLVITVPDARGGQSASFDLQGAQAVQAGLGKSSCG